MEGTFYVPKQVESIPMYDEKTKTYLLIVEGEEATIPEELFHKLFEEHKPRCVLIPVNEGVVDQDTFLKDNLFDKPTFKDACETVKEMGASREETLHQLLEGLENSSFPIDMEKVKITINKIVDKIYDEIDDEDEDEE